MIRTEFLCLTVNVLRLNLACVAHSH